MRITDARLDVALAGESAGANLCFENINLSLAPTADQVVVVNGDATDSLGSKWSVFVTGIPAERRVQARVESSSIELRGELESILPDRWRDWWTHFQPRGHVALDAQLTYDVGSDDPLTYQVLIDPAGVSVNLPPLGERVEDIAGRVEISPKILRVHGLAGRFRSGEIVASGTITTDRSPAFVAVVEGRTLPIRHLGPAVLERFVQTNSVLNGKVEIRGSADPSTWIGELNGTLVDVGPASESVPLHLSIIDSEVWLRDLSFNWAGGTFSVSAAASMDGAAVTSGSVKFDGVRLESLLGPTRERVGEFRGTAAGQIAFRVPLRSWSDATAWRWNGPIQIEDARFGEFDVPSLEGVISCAGGMLTLNDAVANVAGQTFRGLAHVEVEPPHKIEAQYTLAPVALSQFVGSGDHGDPVPVRGKLIANGQLSGQLSPFDLRAGGTVSLQNLSIGDRNIDAASLDYALAGAGLELSRVELKAYGGRISARGRCNFPARNAATAPGPTTSSAAPALPTALRLEGTFEDIDAGSIARDFADGLAVDGRIRGRFTVELPQHVRLSLESIRASGSVRASWLAAGTTKISDVASDFAVADGELHCTNLSATHASGRFTGFATIARRGARPVLTANIASTRIDLAALVARPAGERTLPIRGLAAAEINVGTEPTSGQLRGVGGARITSLVLDELPLIDSVETAQLEFAGNQLVLRNFQATLWGGAARGTATLDLANRSARPAEIVLDRVENIELARVAVAWPQTSSRPRGRISGAGRLTLATNGAGVVVFGAGEYAFKSGLITGLPVAQAEGTIEAFDAATHEIVSGRVQARPAAVARVPDQRLWIRIRNARAARGSVQGTILISLVQPAAYDTSVQFVGLDLATVAQSVFASPYATAGTLSGDLQLGGTSRGPQDTRGEMRLRLQNAQLWSIPPFAVLAKLITLDPTKTGGFHTAEVPRAIIAGNTVDFPEFWLAGDIVQLAGHGRFDSTGRLDMSVVSSLKSDTGRNIPIIGTIQAVVAGIQQRLVKFNVTGTIADPTVVPVPLQDVSEPAIKVLKGITGAILDPSERGGDRSMRR